MQVNRLSLGLQEALKSASNFNTARSETLFDKEEFGVSEEEGQEQELDFSTLNTDDLNITEDQIAGLFAMFQDEVIAVFGSGLPFMSPKNNENDPNANPQNPDAPQNAAGEPPKVEATQSRTFMA